jgi:hypothetical protein
MPLQPDCRHQHQEPTSIQAPNANVNTSAMRQRQYKRHAPTSIQALCANVIPSAKRVGDLPQFTPSAMRQRHPQREARRGSPTIKHKNRH